MDYSLTVMKSVYDIMKLTQDSPLIPSKAVGSPVPQGVKHVV